MSHGEITDIQELINQKWVIFGFALSIGVWALVIAWWRGFFIPLSSSSYPSIRGMDVLKGFAFFLFAEILFIPALIGLIFLAWGTDLDKALDLYPSLKGWMNLLIILGGFLGIGCAYFGMTFAQRKGLWHQTSTPTWMHIGIGVVAWFISYPIVLAFNEGVSLALWHLFHQPFVEQVAVQNVRNVLTTPALFGFTALSIITIVPLTEEFLFRALLQSWLKEKIGKPFVAIVGSSIVFAVFHYSNSHGMTNIELLTSLFLLSCMLGYLYERQKSLWAPIALHSFFNFMSLLMIYRD